MIPTIKAEFTKLLTVRSTYIISLLALALISFLAYYVGGVKNVPLEIAQGSGRLIMAGTIANIAPTISIFCALIGLLHLTHEYRYNTIVYTLTASNSRSKVLAAKIIAVMSYVLVFSVFVTAIGLALLALGASLSHHSLPHQDINFVTYFAKTIFFCEGYALVGLLFAALIRNQVGALAALFILPNTFEGLMTLLLKNNAVYMPFSALGQVIQAPLIKEGQPANPTNSGSLTPGKGALVFLCYLVLTWILTWYLFLKRDAN